MNDRESLEDAVVRETQEELNLILVKDDLKIKGTIYKQDEEILFVIFESIKLIPEDTELKFQKNEITDFQFAEPEMVPSLLPLYYSDFWSKNYVKKF